MRHLFSSTGTEKKQELLKTQAHIFGLKEAEEGIKAGI